MKMMKGKVAKLSFVALLASLSTAMLYTPTASAHGEKSQAAFMRMRTIHWFDMNWSKDQVAINDTMTISGKFFVFAGWPETVDKPEVSFLNVGIPGPVLSVLDHGLVVNWFLVQFLWNWAKLMSSKYC
jgi:methane/ammonia monooxygenase subunit B